MSEAVSDSLNNVIAVLRGGADFYRESAEKVEKASLASLFRQHAEEREAAIAELSTYVESRGDEPASGSWAETAASWYASAKSMFGDKDETLLAQLEEHEDRTLEAIRDAIEELDDTQSAAKAALTRHLDTFKTTHDRMKSIKDAA